MTSKFHGLVGWGCRIHRLHNECPKYDTKQSDVEVSVILKLWGMLCTPSLPSLSDPLWPRVVASETVLSMGQIELNCILMLNRIV